MVLGNGSDSARLMLGCGCSRIHERRPAPTGAVFHTHQTYAAALSALEIDE